MAVDIQFFKTDGTKISLDVATGGIDFGIVRKNQQQVTPVVIKNLGTDEAKNIYVTGSPLHTLASISQDKYNEEVLAGHWKAFSMLPDGQFSSILSLPNIPAGKTMVGIKKYIESFNNPSSSAWKNDTYTGHTFNWTGSSVVVSDSSTVGKVFGYMTSDGWGMNKEVDFTVQFGMPPTSTAGASFVMIGLRKNSLGDGKGYLINVKRTTTSTTGGTCVFEIRKGAGVKTPTVYDFGTVLYTSNAVPFYDFMPIRIKLFTNASGLPELKLWTDKISDTDTTVSWGIAPNTTYSWVDTVNTYPYAGAVELHFGSSGSGIVSGGTKSFEVSEASLLTEDLEGKVYIRTIVGDGAVDSVSYNSSMELFYDPVG